MSNSNQEQVEALNAKLKDAKAKLEKKNRGNKREGPDWSEIAQFFIAISMILTFSFIIYTLISPLTGGTTTATDFSSYKDIISLLATIYGAWIASIIGFYFGRKSGQTIQEAMKAELDYTKTMQTLLSNSAMVGTVSHELTVATADVAKTMDDLRSVEEEIAVLEKEIKEQ